MKIVIVGSFKNKSGILEKRKELLEWGHDVFPDEKFFEGAEPIIVAHHYEKKQLDGDVLITLAEREKIYLDEILLCDLVYVLNEKDGEEYAGTATAIEIGYAHANGIPIRFHREPTDPHLKIISEGLVK